MTDWGKVPDQNERGALAGAAIAVTFVFGLWIAFAVGRIEGDNVYQTLCGPYERGEHHGSAPAEAGDSAEEIGQIDDRAVRSLSAPFSDPPQAANGTIGTRCANAEEYQSTPEWMRRPQALFNDAVEWQAWAALGVFGLTIWIVLLLRGTLDATNKAAELANDTLLVTQRTLAEASKTTMITRKGVEVQEREFALNRAWIYPGLRLDTLRVGEDASFFGQKVSGGFKMSYPLLNIGKQAAFDLDMVAHQYVGVTLPQKPLSYPSPQNQTKITPAGGRAFVIEIMLTDEQIQLLDDERIRAFSYFKVTYRDGISEEIRTTEIVLQVRVNGILTHRDGSRLPGWEIEYLNDLGMVT